MTNQMKCKRCDYTWLPLGVREVPRTGNVYASDLGLCRICNHAKVRLHIWTPGDMVNAELWGQRFEVLGHK